ncbi:MAG: zinc ribbon domain-containing protein [Porcipelethomonas sp.]
MPFCINCGKQLADGTKFCSECGTPTNNDNSKRKSIYDGEIHKCPNCGEVLDSFVSNCPACGFELRGTKSSETVQNFAKRIENAINDAQKIEIIRSYPIPNNKEDVFEFMIIAATNFNAEQSISGNGVSKSVSDAWLTKIEQGYQKARLLFGDNADFIKVQNIYNQTHSQINQSTIKVRNNNIAAIILRTSVMWCGLLLFVLAFFLDVISKANTSIFHFGGMLVMIIGAFVIGKRNAGLADAGAGIACGVISLIMGALLQELFNENGSIMELTGGATLIVIAVMFVKSLNSKRK